MDKLENFIHDHREAFDDESPSEFVWQNIQAEISSMQTKKVARKIHLRWIGGIAASLLIAVIVWQNVEVKPFNAGEQFTMDPVIKSIDPDYAIQVRNFNQEIKTKQVALKELLSDYPDVSESLINDLSQLNKSYEHLRLELKDNPNQKILLEAMVENLNLQISILNNQLNLISQIKNEAKNEINI